MKEFEVLLTNQDGKYGTEAWEKSLTAANGAYHLFELIYLDDRKLTGEDTIDLINVGPKFVTSVVEAAKVANQLDEEASDFSEAEKAKLLTLAGVNIQKPGYQKILKGILEIVDGIAEIGNPDNPID